MAKAPSRWHGEVLEWCQALIVGPCEACEGSGRCPDVDLSALARESELAVAHLSGYKGASGQDPKARESRGAPVEVE